MKKILRKKKTRLMSKLNNKQISFHLKRIKKMIKKLSLVYKRTKINMMCEVLRLNFQIDQGKLTNTSITLL